MSNEQYTTADATHWLLCRHCVGAKSCREYEMKCVLLGETKTGKQKVLVFGERDWKDKDHIKKIRYVNHSQLLKIHGNNDTDSSFQ